MAQDAIADGSAGSRLDEFVSLTRKLGGEP
jgi:hypothetical protein